MIRGLAVAVLVALTGASGLADQYWVDWEGDDWPENQGWTRVWGNQQGDYQGHGAYRTLEDGVLTYDSLYDTSVYDFSKMTRPGQMDPGPSELFVIEWRLKVSQVVGNFDPGIALSSDAAWCVGFDWATDHIYSLFEDLNIPFEPDMFHDYRLVSSDMRQYDLYIDGQLVHIGAFVHLVSPSRIGWGDDIQGAASLHSWDYFRFGVVPEPPTLPLALAFLAGAAIGRRSFSGARPPGAKGAIS